MTSTFDVPDLGRLELVETYEYYDEPVLYACQDATERRYLVVLSVDEPGFQEWLYAPLSARRFQHVRSGGLDLHSAFRAAEGGFIFRLTLQRDPTAAGRGEWVPAQSLDDALLPTPGEALDLPTETLGVRYDTEPDRIAAQSHRDVLTMRFRFDGLTRTEAPAALFGQLLDGVQQVVNAVGQSVVGSPTSRAPIPGNILNRMQLRYVGTFPGSLGVELHAAETADLFGQSDVSRALEQFMGLLAVTSSVDDMLVKLGELRGRTVTKYRDLLDHLETGVQDVEFKWGSPRNPDSVSVVVTREVAKRASVRLRQAVPETETEFEIVGRLRGFNSRTKTYEIWDTYENRKYTGRVDDGALGEIGQAVIDEIYGALLREIHESAPDGETTTKYRLLRLGDRNRLLDGDDEADEDSDGGGEDGLPQDEVLDEVSGGDEEAEPSDEDSEDAAPRDDVEE